MESDRCENSERTGADEMIKNELKHMIIRCIIWAVLYLLSWFMTCGVFKLITLCFDWTFSWNVATGIWIIISFVKIILAKGE